MNSGSERCSIIAADNSPGNSVVLIHLLFLPFLFVGVLAARLIVHHLVKTNNVLLSTPHPPDTLFISLYTIWIFVLFTIF